MDINEQALEFHKKYRGKIQIVPTMEVDIEKDLSVAYTPGVAEPCRKIHENREEVYTYTRKWNNVAIVTDGTAVLGLGDIGPEAALPVMEGKALLFKEFGGVDAFGICLNTKDPDEIVATVKNIAPSFGGINLEDISAPRCFEIEKRLQAVLDIPVFHDDQHGTAIVVLAALTNAFRLVKKGKDSRIVINGSGSAGTAIANLLLSDGYKNITMCDKAGILTLDTALNDAQRELAKNTNPDKLSGTLADAMRASDAFIGVSAPKMVTPLMVTSMNEDAIIFAMANPTPEIFPDEAKAAGARVVGTGRSDYPNQINNVLAFPGIFRGALDARAKAITEEMKLATAHAIASLVSDEELNEDYIIPKAFDKRVCNTVSKAVMDKVVKNN